MATVDRSRPAFVARQRRTYRRMAGIPFARYSLRPSWGRAGDLARPIDAAAFPGAQEVTIPITAERYRLRGYDATTVIEDLYLTFVRRGGRWRVGADDALDAVGLFSAHHLWDSGPVESAESGQFLLLGHPCGSSGPSCVPARFLDLAERALARVNRYWVAPWSREVVVVVPRDGRELTRMLQLTFDPDDFVAFATSSVRGDGGYTGPRIVFNPASLVYRGDSSVVHVLAHELLHVATRGASGPFVPSFVEEGFAEYVGRDADPAFVAAAEDRVASPQARIPEDYEFTTGSVDDIYHSYLESLSAVRYFIDRWGLERFIAFYEELGRRKVAPGTARYHLDDALRRTIGVGFGRFERGWADSIAR